MSGTFDSKDASVAMQFPVVSRFKIQRMYGFYAEES